MTMLIDAAREVVGHTDVRVRERLLMKYTV
jgi:hypothetical protein